MSTNNPCSPHEQNWVKPDTHPSKNVHSNIPKSDWDGDYINLLNTIQRHTQCISVYCLRHKNGKQCRFDYPIDKCKRTHLEFEKVHTKDGTSKYKAAIVTTGNDTRFNCHQRLQLQGWRANCDITIIIDYHSWVDCLTKYASKSEKLSAVVRDAFVSVIKQTSDDAKINTTMKKLMMKVVSQRDMSIQEVMHHILFTKLLSSSFQVITVSLHGSRNVRMTDNEMVSEPSVLDFYAERHQFEEHDPNITDWNFLQFVSNHHCKDQKLHKKAHPVIVRTFPTFSSNPKGPYYGDFCKY